MYLHIGNNQMIKLEDVIAIINLQTIYDSQEAHQVLEKILNNKENKSLDIDGKHRKSLIISERIFYYSPISTTTLLERSKFPWVS